MMKKLLSLVAAALFIVSCTQVDIDDAIVKDTLSGETITLSVNSTSSVGTRVALGYDSEGAISVTWLEDDNLGAWWDGTSSLSKFEMVDGSLSEDSSSANFTGDVAAGTIRLVHPYVESQVVSNCLEISHAEQSVDMSGDGFDNMGSSTYMVSPAFDLPLGDDTAITLQHVGSIIKVGMRFFNLPTSEDGEEPITYILEKIEIGDELANGAWIDLSYGLDEDGFYDTTTGSITAIVENSPSIEAYTEANEATYYLPINIMPCTVEAGCEVPLMVYITGSNGYTYTQYFTIEVAEEVEFERATYNSVNYNCNMEDAEVSQITWADFAASSFAGGSGTESDPYQIATAEQMAYFAVQLNTGSSGKPGQNTTKYTLTADVDLLDRQWVYINNGFSGIFDGAGHTISGLYMSYPDQTSVALFPYTSSSAVVKNLLVDGFVEGYDSVGGIVGSNYGEIFQCGFSGETKGYYEYGNIYLGGLTGYSDGTISNSYNLATVTYAHTETDDSWIGGITGYNHYGSIHLCYNGGEVTTNGTSDFMGAIAGSNEMGTVTSCVASVVPDHVVSGENGTVVSSAAEAVEALNATADTEYGYNKWMVSGNYAVLDFDTVSTAEATWINCAASSYAGGNGSESNPYLIATDDQMALLLKDVDDGNSGNYYQLTADINLSAYEWSETSNYFSGILDGAGYTISGLRFSSSDNGALFIGLKTDAVVKNLYLDVDITSSSHAAGIAISNYGTIINCGVSGSITSLGEEYTYNIGSIAAQNNGSISNSFSVAEVTYAGDEPYVGGIVGDNKGSVNLCYFAGAFIDGGADPHLGAIAGYSFGTAANCYSTTFGDEYGYNGTHVDDMQTLLTSLNESVDEVYGAYVWEISSESYPTFSTQLSSAEYPAKWDDNVATAFASGSGTSEDPYMIAKASQLAYLGQLIDAGSTNGDYYALACDVDLKNIPWITYDYNDAFNGYFDGNGYTVTGFYTSGGSDYMYVSLLGNLAEGYKVSNLNVVGDLTMGGNSVSSAQGGGLVNRNYGTVINCSFGGSITMQTQWGTWAYAGGITGSNDGKVFNCYNSATITNNDESSGQGTAGIVASNVGAVRLCYNVGVVSGGTDANRAAISSGNTATYSFTLNNGTYSDSSYESSTISYVKRYDEGEGYMKSTDFINDLNSLVDSLIDSGYIDADCCQWSLGSGDYLYPVFQKEESTDNRE
ncbi:MAG: hypothetical protein SNI20_04185 [Rikenellaceae bacterium]